MQEAFGLAELLGDNLWVRAISIYVLTTFLLAHRVLLGELRMGRGHT